MEKNKYSCKCSKLFVMQEREKKKEKKKEEKMKKRVCNKKKIQTLNLQTSCPRGPTKKKNNDNIIY